MEEFKGSFKNYEIKYADLETQLSIAMGFEGTLNYILRKEVIRRFDSVENFLRKCKLGEYIDLIKKSFWKE